MSTNEYTGPYAEGEPYAKVVFKPFATGKQCEEREPHQPKGVWHLDIDDFHDALKSITPRMYFVTSGEAVLKASKLCEDLAKALAVSKKMHTILKALKDDAQYLETQWENDRLLVKKKFTRPTSRINVKRVQAELERKIAKARRLVKNNEPVDLKCPKCDKECSSVAGFKLHTKVCKAKTKQAKDLSSDFICGCGKICSSKSGLTLHIKKCGG